MIDINMPAYPAHKPCLRPTEMVIDAGYSPKNHKVLSKLARKLKIRKSYPDTFFGFFELYDTVKQKDIKARDVLPEFGYSPYNLMLVINSLELHKEQFAEFIDCSFSKVLANTTHRNNDYFRPMVGTQWHDLIACYVNMITDSNQQHITNYDKESLFFMRADKSLPLKPPTLEA